MRLAGKAAIITGAADGIGRATAVKFAQEGADSLLFDINRAGVEETAARVVETGRRGEVLVGDLADADTLQRIVDTAVEQLGGFDILVNNAGIFSGGHILEFSPEDYDRLMSINLRAPFFLAQLAGRYWVAEGRPGRIVNLSSVNALVALRDSAAYTASKGAITALTRALALELAPNDITVNAVGPGVIRTGMNRGLLDGTRLEDSWTKRTPLGRLGDPADIANAIAFLASDEASYITGQILYVEGGRTIRMA